MVAMRYIYIYFFSRIVFLRSVSFRSNFLFLFRSFCSFCFFFFYFRILCCAVLYIPLSTVAVLCYIFRCELSLSLAVVCVLFPVFISHSMVCRVCALDLKRKHARSVLYLSEFRAERHIWL